MRYSVSIEGKDFDVEICSGQNGGWTCRLNGRAISVDFVALGANSASLLINGRSFEIRRDGGGIFVGAHRYEVSIEDPRSWQGRKRRESAQGGPLRVTAPMPGKIVRILGREGDDIQAGQGIIVVEAMKMQNEIKSPRSGKLQKIMVREGASVNAGEALAIVE